MASLDFIGDKDLRITLESSIEYIFTLYEKSKGSEENQLYREETYRVIVLYVISAIEAVLLYFYKERGEKIQYMEYKFIEQLSSNYSHKGKVDLPVIVAVQEKVEKKEYQIGLHDLVIFFRDRKLIKKDTVSNILELNDVRNTFHFSKSRTKKCDIKTVENALSLLVHTLEKAPNSLKPRN